MTKCNLLLMLAAVAITSCVVGTAEVETSLHISVDMDCTCQCQQRELTGSGSDSSGSGTGWGKGTRCENGVCESPIAAGPGMDSDPAVEDVDFPSGPEPRGCACHRRKCTQGCRSAAGRKCRDIRECRRKFFSNINDTDESEAEIEESSEPWSKGQDKGYSIEKRTSSCACLEGKCSRGCSQAAGKNCGDIVDCKQISFENSKDEFEFMKETEDVRGEMSVQISFDRDSSACGCDGRLCTQNCGPVAGTKCKVVEDCERRSVRNCVCQDLKCASECPSASGRPCKINADCERYSLWAQQRVEAGGRIINRQA